MTSRAKIQFSIPQLKISQTCPTVRSCAQIRHRNNPKRPPRNRQMPSNPLQQQDTPGNQSRNQARLFSSFLALLFSLNAFNSDLLIRLLALSAFKLRPSSAFAAASTSKKAFICRRDLASSVWRPGPMSSCWNWPVKRLKAAAEVYPSSRLGTSDGPEGSSGWLYFWAYHALGS